MSGRTRVNASGCFEVSGARTFVIKAVSAVKGKELRLKPFRLVPRNCLKACKLLACFPHVSGALKTLRHARRTYNIDIPQDGLTYDVACTNTGARLLVATTSATLAQLTALLCPGPRMGSDPDAVDPIAKYVLPRSADAIVAQQARVQWIPPERLASLKQTAMEQLRKARVQETAGKNKAEVQQQQGATECSCSGTDEDKTAASNRTPVNTNSASVRPGDNPGLLPDKSTQPLPQPGVYLSDASCWAQWR
ncbi:hypothetical protein Vretifemale_14872 [Volvox reticuliferus]|uniref:Uncharacterized protein n=1 Tax=Volvox reticuliferus TaxID=1737510 RepID=A0A8J4CTT4_9CHLO|nr:hypothetical protein Vretifemale_14872 [Volvox reticuliferus]